MLPRFLLIGNITKGVKYEKVIKLFIFMFTGDGQH